MEKKKKKSQFQAFKDSSDSFFKDVFESTKSAFNESGASGNIIPLPSPQKPSPPAALGPDDSGKDPESEKTAEKKPEGQTFSQTVTQTVSQTLKQADRQSNRQTVGHSDRQTDTLSDRHSEKQSDRHSLRQSVRHSHDENPDFLSSKQLGILEYLISNESRVTTLSDISKNTNVPYGTVRGSLNRLVKENFISRPVRYRKGMFQGITYTINDVKCKSVKEYFKAHSEGRHSDRQSHGHSDGRTVSQTLCQTDSQTLTHPYMFSSSSLNNITTTCARAREDETPHPEIEALLCGHPEFGYWRQKGLTAKQVGSWIKTAGVSLSTMASYLCWCRFDMVENDFEAKKPVNNVFNYFFKVLERSGGYPKPENYVSFEDKRLSEEREAAEHAAGLAKEAEMIYRERLESEQAARFWNMMGLPDSEMYKKCLEALPEMFRLKARKSGTAFETAMRQAFDRLMEEE